MIYCKYDELINPNKLKNHPKNRNKHGQDQIERLAKLYEFHGVRHPIIVSKRSGCIVAGHGRKLAAIRAGIKEMPVVYQDFESDDKEYAFLVSDNAIALWADLDLSGINEDLKDLGPFDIDMLGLRDFTIDPFERNGSEELSDETKYTKNIKLPIYEPTGPKPKLNELFDRSKADELIDRIKKAKVPDDLKEFLTTAANRHVVFNYKNIAEFYSHEIEEEVKELFEQSALVVIDYEKALEYGFVKLTKDLASLYDKE